jgi:hypothetical protein
MHNEKKCVNGTLHHCKEKATLEVLQNKTRYKKKKNRWMCGYPAWPFKQLAH